MFVDYINSQKFYGLTGVQQSIELYKKVLSDIKITVEEQLLDGNRVTSRFVVTRIMVGECNSTGLQLVALKMD
jgi:hypothetical protein